ncbi:protein GLUTAMINE DUMPER 4-like [Vigna umbellata]|uniref:protein GLUTAMINE DUMPER 4-like n=1 Tax=Vigna umbellata TaxID=87088 RepID=UPI001F5EF356|nr:protein GLUTAMINE DUMPER 4-like [Vigna umbellata]
MRSFPIPTNTKTTTLAPTTSTVQTLTTTSTRTTSTSTSTSSPLASPWHSPVPYLFGGLAIIMALISMALFILACSYWRLTRSTQQRDLENMNTNKEGDDDPQEKEQPLVYEEKILVIMAGDHKPTFLATPSTNTNFHKHLANSENLEISDNKRVVLDDDVSDRNGSSREHNQQPSQ